MKNILLTLVGLGIIGGAVVWFVMVRPTRAHAKNTFLVEETKSVTTEVRTEAHDVVETSVTLLQRGDELVVVPLTGDAAVEAPGKILRVRLSEKRTAYDGDLKKARTKTRDMLNQMRDEAEVRPYTHTDLLGSMNLLIEEKKAGDLKGEVFTLVVLSDMIQDTPNISFMTNPALANDEAARKLAGKLVAGNAGTLAGAHVFLGQLRSEDLKSASMQRREAIRSFWIEYFRLAGATDVVFARDGVGQLVDFMRRVKSVE
jgi:hypothetical protein